MQSGSKRPGWWVLALLIGAMIGGCGGSGGSGDAEEVDEWEEEAPPTVAAGWTKSTANPVLLPGPAGSWDDYSVNSPHVLQLGPTAYSMWYQGKSWSSRQIGRATSTNGITWVKSILPVLTGTSGSWDQAGVGNPSVLYDGITYRMWYDSTSRIGYATSVDGVTWVKSASPVLEKGASASWDGEGVGEPCVIKENGVYRMWYVGRKIWYLGWIPITTKAFGYATSTNGFTWTKYAGNPVLSPGPGQSWDSAEVSGPSVAQIGGTLRMWYAGWGAVFSQYVGFAESSDGITWTKPPGNPILGPGTAAAWDGEEVFSPCAIQDGPIVKLWYGAESQAGFSARIGYATNP